MDSRPAALFAVALLFLSAGALATTYCTPGFECKTTDECGLFDACSCRTGFDANGICSTCDLAQKRPTSNLACGYSGAVVPSTWTPTDGERVVVRVEPSNISCCNDPFFAGCREYGEHYRPVVVENRVGIVVAANFFWENYKDNDCIGMKVPFSSFEFTAYATAAPYRIRQLTSQYAFHADLDHAGFYDLENYDGYPENSTPECMSYRKDSCEGKYWQAVGSISVGKCEGADSCRGQAPYQIWRSFDYQTCSYTDRSCEYGCGATVAKNESDKRYYPPLCDDFGGCGYGEPYCRAIYCGATCEKDADCGQSECAEGNATIDVSGGMCAGNCTCSFAGKYNCNGTADECRQVSCNGQRYYCTQNNGTWGWWRSPDCNDNNACTQNDSCTMTANVPAKGACAGTAKACADSCGANKLQIGGTCSSGKCYPASAYNCESGFDSCKRATCGGEEYYCTDYGQKGNYTWTREPSCRASDACTANLTCKGGSAFAPGACTASKNALGGYTAFNYTCADVCGAGDPTLLLLGMKCDGKGGCEPSSIAACDGNAKNANKCATKACGNLTYYCGLRGNSWGWSLSASLGNDTCDGNWINTSESCNAAGQGGKSFRCIDANDSCRHAACNGEEFYCTNAGSQNKSEWKWAKVVNNTAACDDGNDCTNFDSCELGQLGADGNGTCTGKAYSCADSCGPNWMSRERTCTGREPPYECADTAVTDECSEENHAMCLVAKCGGTNDNIRRYIRAESEYRCTNFNGTWAWRPGKDCFDGDYCTQGDSCTADAASSGAPGKCEGKAVQTGEYCVDAAGLTILGGSKTLTSQPALCCYSGTRPTSSSCVLGASWGGIVPDQKCVKYSCTGDGLAAFAPLGETTECGRTECPAGTNRTGCTRYCNQDGTCGTCTPNCALQSSDDMALSCPKRTTETAANLTVTVFINGTPDCGAEPKITVTGPTTEKYLRAECTAGVSRFEVRTGEAAKYAVSARLDRLGIASIVRECSIDSFPIKSAGQFQADTLFVVIVAMLGLPLGIGLVLVMLRRPD